MMNDNITKCKGCDREFSKSSSLNSHKRFCEKWKSLNLQVRKSILTLEERKTVKSDCPNCKKEFSNVYSMSAHKAHCLGLNKYESRSKESKDKQAWNRGKILKSKEDIFCKKSKCSTGYAKNALLSLKLAEYQCQQCGIREWQNKKITLELDHINGDNQDHRLENIHLLCPNCHSQTPNWRGRNKNKGKKLVSDNNLIAALNNSKSIRSALMSVGMAPKGANYIRCRKLINLNKNRKSNN